jgi:NAD(P)-dependent dehydrogenase (short-subunit alcohol dehydrogenase family)
MSPAHGRGDAGLVVITDDELGVARRARGALMASGRPVIVVRAVGDSGSGTDAVGVDLSDPVAVERFVAEVRGRHSSKISLLHLLPLHTCPPIETLDLACWRRAMVLDVKSLFHLARAFGAEPSGHGSLAHGTLLVVTGSAAAGLLPSPSAPAGGAGAAGLARTLALEWPLVDVRILHLDPHVEASLLADRALAEFHRVGTEREVAYVGDRRVRPVVVPAPLKAGSRARLSVGSEWVILLTGGARGITAQVALELAERYSPTLVLLGKTPYPAADEAPETIGLAEPSALRAAIIAGAQGNGLRPSPAEVEAACRRLLAEREMRATFGALREAGAWVTYLRADVRDDEALGRALDTVYARFGRLDGVVHAAGVVEDQLVQDKSADSFDRVFDTKVDAAHTLARRLRHDSLRFLVFFTSVAGKFGNRGQGDYAAANEVLSQLARTLDDRWAARVVAMSWGPWAGGGMVSPGLADEFARKGIGLIPPATGRRLFDDELRWGGHDSEVVLGSGPWARPYGIGCNALPMTLNPTETGTLVAHTISVDRDGYLADHRLDGRPVLPLAMAAEVVAEAAQLTRPGLDVVELRRFVLLQGVVAEENLVNLEVEVSPRAKNDDGVDAELRRQGSARAAYRGHVVLGPGLADGHSSLGEGFARRDAHPDQSVAMSAQDVYRLLFHGPTLRCIQEVWDLGATGCVARVRTSEPGRWSGGAVGRYWVLDPALLDAGPQLVIVWSRVLRGTTALPTRVELIRRHQPPVPGQLLTCRLAVHPDSDDRLVIADAEFASPDGHPVLTVRGLEAVAAPELNRLAARAGAP